MIGAFRSSIGLKLAVLVLGGASIVLGLIIGYSYFWSRQIILREGEQRARYLTVSVARRIEQEFRAVSETTDHMALTLETHSYDDAALRQLLRRTVVNNPELYGSAVAYVPFAFRADVQFYAPYFFRTKQGIASCDLAPPSYYYVQHDWYQIPIELKTPVWSEPYFDEGGGDILMTTYSSPVIERTSAGSPAKVKAIVTADVSLEWLTGLLSSMSVGSHGYFFLISGKGRFVSHPRTEYIMRESIFSLAQAWSKPQLRAVGRSMIRNESGFVDLEMDFMGQQAYLAYARIPSTGWSLGAVFPREELFAAITSLHRETLTMAVAAVVLLVVVSLLVAGSIARPLRRMAGAAMQVAAGDLDVNLGDIRSSDEVGQLAGAFVRMTAGLKERDFIRNTFGRYLTKEVVNRLLEHKDGLRLGGEAREISILMSDLRGFTAMTSPMQPEDVIAFLNRYLGKMLEILIDYRGTIDEIVGDGILAFFGAPESLDDHPARAVACALKMQIAMDEINALNEADGFPRLEMGVAVNTGRVVVGNIGSEQRTKYGAVGAQVNFTGRIESFTVGGQVLISESTFLRLKESLDVKRTVHVEMKGMPDKVTLHEVRGIAGLYEAHLPERYDAPVRLDQGIDVKVYRLNEKTVDGSVMSALISEVSLTRATLVFSEPIRQWEDLRMILLDGPTKETAGEVYGKVVAVKQQENRYEALVRFTSVSPEAYGLFRRVAPQR